MYKIDKINSNTIESILQQYSLWFTERAQPFVHIDRPHRKKVPITRSELGQRDRHRQRQRLHVPYFAPIVRFGGRRRLLVRVQLITSNNLVIV